ncbi:MAG TPA: DinB family protein [Dehalococcoidales bacterium]|nr:DinB family protein [Dehalococcoidales bacterium]
MEWHQMLSDGYGRIEEILGRVLNGLSQEDLRFQPRPDGNSIGWLAWHLTRVQDDHIADLMREAQLWIKDGWHKKFHRPADPKDVGFGHTPDQVAAFRPPDAATLLAYHRAALARSRAFFPTLSRKDLDRELNEPWFQPLPTVGVRLISVLADNLEHAGQAAYVRGVLQGKGWQPF